MVSRLIKDEQSVWDGFLGLVVSPCSRRHTLLLLLLLVVIAAICHALHGLGLVTDQALPLRISTLNLFVLLKQIAVDAAECADVVLAVALETILLGDFLALLRLHDELEGAAGHPEPGHALHICVSRRM